MESLQQEIWIKLSFEPKTFTIQFDDIKNLDYNLNRLKFLLDSCCKFSFRLNLM